MQIITQLKHHGNYAKMRTQLTYFTTFFLIFYALFTFLAKFTCFVLDNNTSTRHFTLYSFIISAPFLLHTRLRCVHPLAFFIYRSPLLLQLLFYTTHREYTCIRVFPKRALRNSMNSL